jgi:hypothetical protein
MLRWSYTPILSQDIHLFSRLPREVRVSFYFLDSSVLVLIKCRVILASIRDKGNCPCPRCLTTLSHVENLGTIRDMTRRKTLARVDDDTRRRQVEMARDIIYKKNYAVNSSAVENILKEKSLVPTAVSAMNRHRSKQTLMSTQNAFSQRLAPLGFNLFLMLVVDLMHEFELGIWKALFIHLLRILNAVDKGLVNELD